MLSHTRCAFVSVWHYEYLPNALGAVAADCARKGKGTMNDIDRQRAAEHLPVPGTLS